LKQLLLVLLLNAIGWGASYDPFLLDTQLSLLPKIAMLEKSASRAKAPFKILIAYDRTDEATAASCSQTMVGKFNGRPVTVSRLPFDRLEDAGTYHLVYVLKGSVPQLKKVYNAFASSGALTALYDGDKLRESGFLLSIQMQRTPVILINAKVLRENRFSFPDSLLEISKIID
jgi:hypothetical protein